MKQEKNISGSLEERIVKLEAETTVQLKFIQKEISEIKRILEKLVSVAEKHDHIEQRLSLLERKVENIEKSQIEWKTQTKDNEEVISELKRKMEERGGMLFGLMKDFVLLLLGALVTFGAVILEKVIGGKG